MRLLIPFAITLSLVLLPHAFATQDAEGDGVLDVPFAGLADEQVDCGSPAADLVEAVAYTYAGSLYVMLAVADLAARDIRCDYAGSWVGTTGETLYFDATLETSDEVPTDPLGLGLSSAPKLTIEMFAVFSYGSHGGCIRVESEGRSTGCLGSPIVEGSNVTWSIPVAGVLEGPDSSQEYDLSGMLVRGHASATLESAYPGIGVRDVAIIEETTL